MDSRHSKPKISRMSKYTTRSTCCSRTDWLTPIAEAADAEVAVEMEAIVAAAASWSASLTRATSQEKVRPYKDCGRQERNGRDAFCGEVPSR